MNPQDYVVLDLQSGTYFSAEDSVIINWNTLTEDQREVMVNGSDTERCLLADEVGIAWSGIN